MCVKYWPTVLLPSADHCASMRGCGQQTAVNPETLQRSLLSNPSRPPERKQAEMKSRGWKNPFFPSLPPWAYLSDRQGEGEKKSSQATAASFSRSPFQPPPIVMWLLRDWMEHGWVITTWACVVRGPRRTGEMTLNNSLFRIYNLLWALLPAVQREGNTEPKNVHGGGLICQSNSFFSSVPTFQLLSVSLFLACTPSTLYYFPSSQPPPRRAALINLLHLHSAQFKGEKIHPLSMSNRFFHVLMLFTADFNLVLFPPPTPPTSPPATLLV